MTDLEYIEIAIDKIKGYFTLITVKVMTFYKNGDIELGNSLFDKDLYLELYLYLLQYSTGWMDEDDMMREDSPLSLSDLDIIVDKSDELIKTIYNNPITI